MVFWKKQRTYEVIQKLGRGVPEFPCLYESHSQANEVRVRDPESTQVPLELGHDIFDVSLDRELERSTFQVVFNGKNSVHSSDLDSPARSDHLGKQIVGSFDVFDDNVRICFYRDPVICIILEESGSGSKIIMPSE